jgi:mRNA-degrading endonuclease RelE of RelBE toxin-antitoxin system
MIHHRDSKFIAMFNSLPAEVQQLAKKAFAQLKLDPRHPSLQFKPVNSKRGNYEVRVGNYYRAVAFNVEPGVFLWWWIGTHADFNKKF